MIKITRISSTLRCALTGPLFGVIRQHYFCNHCPKLGLPKELRRCLGSTNMIESPNSGIRSRMCRVKNWQDYKMVIRGVASSLLDMEQRFKRIMGYQQLWMLEARLRELAE